MPFCMPGLWRSYPVALSILALQITTGSAEQETAAAVAAQEAPSYTRAAEIKVTVHPDLTATHEKTVRIKILSESGIGENGQQELYYDETVDPVEVDEAYTEKADGTRIAVDPADILTRDQANGLDAVYQRDAKVKTIIFPDLEVGDTLVYRTHSRDIDKRFPGHLFLSYTLPRAVPYASFRLTVELPPELRIKVAVRGEITETSEASSNGKRLVFSYSAPFQEADEANAVSWLDRDPEIVMTDFADYQQLGESYWTSIRGKAAVTQEIQTLADEIARGIEGKKAQAEAISGWVKKNIRYVLVFFGSGGITPNPAAVVLKNKYGDCKDHMVLMIALLKAKGIAAEPALVNLGNEYKLAALPVPNFNHVIVYLPEFALYDDPTASSAAFGVLSARTYDKPVLLLSEAGGQLVKTPAMKPDDNVVTAKTVAEVSADGAVTGETSITATGIFASDSRWAALEMQKRGRPKFAEQILRGLKHPGKGAFDRVAPYNFSEPYSLHGTFRLDDKLEVPLKGQRDIPVGLPIHDNPVDWFFGARVDRRKSDFICDAGKQVSEIEVTFAEGLPLPKPLEPLWVSNSYFSFAEASSVGGRTLHIRWEFTSNVPDQVCASTIEPEIGPLLKTVARKLNEQMAFEAGSSTAVAATN
ncbi:MAG: DUF3857 domain-containing protein [Rhodomicrobium sp.]